jgi:RNA polymerase sigma factor (TIGR02999 family)
MSGGEITRLLGELRAGRREALDDLLPLVYAELRDLARRRLGCAPGVATLSATEIVHETYLRLADRPGLALEDRRHFFAVAAIAMRQILVDRARRRRARKRGGGQRPLDLDQVQAGAEDPVELVLSLDQALRRLAEVDERLARVVELRFFGGLSVEEAAEVLEVDPRTVKRDWRKARALLLDSLGGA